MRRIRNKFRNPKRPWDSARIKEEKDLLREYGLRRKEELRVSEEMLRNIRQRARNLITEEDKRKEKVLLDKLSKQGILKPGSNLDDVLALTVKDVLDRRLQTIVLRKGLAKTSRQARQAITHGRIAIEARRTTFPSHIVTMEEEGKIGWYGKPGGK
ncbi:MAG: 30S ribosomal protein S4 [Candidatus Aenigmatarchaeota archaeon]